MSVETTDDGTYELDARKIDGEPFDDIMAALEGLGEGERLVLVNSFEPVPLYNVLDRRGYAHETTQKADDEWRISITHA
jgi:uncharacterized protein (DUF2249 family)